MNRSTFSRLCRICCNYIFPLILLLYPLRHIYWGLDLWDTGYNYANFRYGAEHMDAMWFFATYLSNAAGHFLTMLPGGHTLLFMNLYTGLLVSILALAAYFFLTKRMKISGGVVFVGEMAAVSLCWCPTALLYNYLTYILFLAGILFLYEGLTQDKNRYLALAGVMLGCNVFVRFSNLPEAGMIVVVWVYAVFCRKKVKKVIQETGFCMLGYVGAVCFWLGFLSLRYGFSNYAEGIKALFAMTETATDYKAVSMVYKIVAGYVENFYWVIRIFVFALPGIVACLVLPKKWKQVKRAVCAVAAGACAVWLYSRRDVYGNRLFCDLRFDEYSSMLKPGILFLILTLVLCLIRIFGKKADKGEKLFAGLVFLSVLITSIGSNNGLLPSINNLFLAAPYVLWNIYALCRDGKEWKIPVSLPVKALAIMFTGIFLFQSFGFGAKFAFAEATGIKNMDTKAENNAILKGIYMSREKAEWMEEISAYVAENRLAGREVVLYGNIPSLSFYLEMPSAFNPWSDLYSYSAASMTRAFEELREELEAGREYPVVILSRNVSPDAEAPFSSDDVKLDMILRFMEDYGYGATFSNDRFVLYEAGER